MYVDVKNSYEYGKETEASDQFIASVAKGQKRKVSATFSQSYSLGTSAKYYDLVSVANKLGVKITLSVSDTFSGPEKKSKHNSREFRVKFYKQKVKVTQKAKGNISKHTTKYNFDYIRPTKYLEYSIDHNVK